MADSGQASVLNRQSFSRFVFAFTFPSASFDERRHLVVQQTVADSIPLWQAAPFAENDLLQHVHDFLHNEIDTRSTASRWVMTNDALQSRDVFWTNTASWTLISNGVSGGASIPFTFDGVELNLFSGGVGLLAFTVRPESNRKQVATPLETWWDFIHFFRFARNQREVYLQAERRTGRDSGENFVPQVALDSAGQRGDNQLLMMDVITGLLQGISAPTDAETWWQEVFVSGQLIPYVALFTQNVPDAQFPEVVYRTRNFFNSRQDIRPLATELDLDNHPGVLPYVDGAWFTLSLDGGAFVASDRLPDSGFFTATLPEHIKNLYYVIFLLAQYQRFVLMRLSNEVAKVGRSDASEEQLRIQSAALDEIRNDFTAFTTRGYFTQITQQEHHHNVYRHWQETFQIARLYEDAMNAIEQLSRHITDAGQRRANELQEIANAQAAKRLAKDAERENFIRYLTAVLIGPALAMSTLNATNDLVSMKQAAIGVVLGLMAGVAAVLLFDLWDKWRRDE